MGAWLYHWLGLSGTGPVYGFLSGSGSDLGEIALVGGVLGAYHKHACHQGRCWRIGRHVVNGTPWCNKHHEAARKTGSEGS